MSEEEKKAIDRIDTIQDLIIEYGQYNADIEDVEYFSKILNLIKKQSKEINDTHDLCNKMWENKIKAKIDSKFREAKGLYERGVQPQAQYTMKLLKDLEEELLSKEE